MEDMEQRAGLDTPEPGAAPDPDDASRGEAEKDAPDERVVGPSWWEGGSRPEESAEDVPDTYRGAGYIYRGVRYGEAVPEPQSQQERNDDDDPVDLSALGVTSEDQPDVPLAEGDEMAGTAAEPAWWEGGPRPEEPAEDAPEHGDEPVDVSVPVPAPEDQPAFPTAEAGETREPVVESPWWEIGSKPEEAPGEHPAHQSGESDLGTPYLSSGMGYGDSRAAEEPHDDDPVDLSVPALMSKERPAEEPKDNDEPADTYAPAATPEDPVAAAEAGEEPAGEDPPSDGDEPAPRPPASPAESEGAADALPEGSSPGELIHSMVAGICPDELLLVGATPPSLPEWAGAAVAALRNDLDRRLAERSPGDAQEYLRLAIVENALGLHEEADGHLKEALPRSDRFGPVLNALAVTSLARGRVAPAIVYCKETLRETGGDDLVRAAASSNLGDLYDLQGDAARAVEAYETAIDCLQAQGDTRWLSRLHLRVGRLYRRLGQADKARLHFSDSVRLFKDAGDEPGQVRSLAALGSSFTESGLHDLALRSFEEAVRICLRTADKPGAALVQDELGVAYMAQDQLTRALAYFESALSLHRELGNRQDEAATLNHMGKIHDSRGDVDEARRFYEAAMEINRALGHDAGEAGRQPRIESGDPDDARARLLKAEEIFSRAGSAERQEDTHGGHGRGTGGLW